MSRHQRNLVTGGRVFSCGRYGGKGYLWAVWHRESDTYDVTRGHHVIRDPLASGRTTTYAAGRESALSFEPLASELPRHVASQVLANAKERDWAIRLGSALLPQIESSLRVFREARCLLTAAKLERHHVERVIRVFNSETGELYGWNHVSAFWFALDVLGGKAAAPAPEVDLLSLESPRLAAALGHRPVADEALGQER